jgi:RecJ-like exonuclease
MSEDNARSATATGRECPWCQGFGHQTGSEQDCEVCDGTGKTEVGQGEYREVENDA